MAILYLLIVVVGFVFLLEPAELEMKPREAKLMGFICVGLGLALLVPFAAAPFLPRRGWRGLSGSC